MQHNYYARLYHRQMDIVPNNIVYYMNIPIQCVLNCRLDCQCRYRSSQPQRIKINIGIIGGRKHRGAHF